MVKARKPFEKSIRRVRGVLALHPDLHGSRGRPRQHVSDVLRGALVLAVGALDGLVLEGVLETIAPAARVNGLGPNLGKWVKEEPDRFLAVLAAADPYAELTEIARDHLSHLTFQNPAMIEGVLHDVGGCDAPWERAAKRLSRSGKTWTDAGVRTRLEVFVRRRHAIAHSGDLAGGRRATPITLPYVREATEVIEAAGISVCEVIDARIRRAVRTGR